MDEFLSNEIPGTGGSLRLSPEDFLVEEIPLYPACGEGEHLYLEIEKSGISTLELVRRLARASGCRERDIGYAGLKDAQARTRQTVSLPARHEKQLATFESPNIQILSANRHRNKLRLGHLLGNHFRIYLRNTAPGSAKLARAVLDVLETKGVPNLFGEQRYGLLGNNHLVGGALLRGDYHAGIDALMGNPEKILDPRWREGVTLYRSGKLDDAWQALPAGCRHEKTVIRALLKGESHRKALLRLPRNALRLFLSAWQSHLFDQLVRERLQQLGKIEKGDLAYKHENGACFLVEEPDLEQPRADRFDISPTAALFGGKTAMAEGEPGRRERNLLVEEKLPEDAFKLPGGLSLHGERRPMRVPLREIDVVQEEEALVVSFSLPRGSFATTVMREIMKPSENTNI